MKLFNNVKLKHHKFIRRIKTKWRENASGQNIFKIELSFIGKPKPHTEI